MFTWTIDFFLLLCLSSTNPLLQEIGSKLLTANQGQISFCTYDDGHSLIRVEDSFCADQPRPQVGK